MSMFSAAVPTPGRQENLRRENLKVPSLEPQIEFFVETFSHELAKYLDFTVRHSVANLPRTPLRPFHQLLLLQRLLIFTNFSRGTRKNLYHRRLMGSDPTYCFIYLR